MTGQAIGTSQRVERLLEQVRTADLEWLLVTDLTDLRYLTGFTGSNGLALVGPGGRLFLSDFRYVEQSAEEVDSSFERITATQDLLEGLADVLGEGPLRLGFDQDRTTVAELGNLRELLGGHVELVEAGGVVRGLRELKEPSEIERIAAAARIADEALEEVLAGGLIGRSERELALELEVAMRKGGADGPSFPPIIAAGPHGALPHAQPRDVRIEADQLVVIDWGALLDGYCSDCTRTVATGDPGDQAREVYETVLRAQLTGVEGVRAGHNAREVDAEAREVIEAAGYGEQYGHGLGHGVGLDIHERPTLSQRREDTLQVGNVVTVEPGIYLPGRFGVRIEDLVVVGEDGAEILTGIDKGLRIVH